MKSTVTNASLLIMAFTLFLILPSAVFAGGNLDGKVFTVILDGENDIITFQDGMFHSSSCDQYGFNKGEYMTSGDGDNISFKATTMSKKHGTLVWTGDIHGDNIKGSQLWTKKGLFGTTQKTKSFEGSLKP